ncbi:MAG: NAD-dependent epimerase/dehydratase family protein [Chloroflexota bacterium]
MKILMIGGTAFSGRVMAEYAWQRGHQVTVFHRGHTGAGLPAEIRQILGDRDHELARLPDERWDAVIDTCAFFPRQVRALVEGLKGRVEHYTLISSISAYDGTRQRGIAEHSRLAPPPAGVNLEAQTEVSGENYGPLKVACEQALQRSLPGKALVIRPGLIVGPNDRSDRFTYWPWRVAQGGDVLAPGRPDRGLQFIDARDLGEWTVRMVEQRAAGVFNADGLPEAVSMGDLLELCKQAGGSGARLHWASDEFLLANQVGPWIEMPLWIPESDPDSIGFSAISVDKALASGLTFRPLADTVQDTLAFANSRPADHAWRAGLPLEKENRLIRKLNAQTGGR